MQTDYKRKLASIQRIAEVKPIPDADKIVAYRINGWWIVDQKDKYIIGDLVVYAEPDSFVPTELAPFLSKGKEPKVYKGVRGERLRTQKLRGQLSQGLLLPIPADTIAGAGILVQEGLDLTDHLGILLWEPEPDFKHADAKGLFPSFLRKSDQVRLQNVFNDVKELLKTQEFEKSEKLEGSSHSSYYYNGEFGVCSRNLELKESTDNTFWSVAIKYKLKEKLQKLGRNLMLQGEMIGPGIQGNIYQINEHKLFIYDIFCIDTQTYFTPVERLDLLEELELESVPILNLWYTNFASITCDELIAFADGKSELNPKANREGVVYKMHSKERISFKIISNQYLLKQQ